MLVADGGEPGRFRLADGEIRRARAYGRERGTEIVALFHSHPSGEPSLSAADRASLARSEWPWVVVTVRRGTARLAGYAAGTCEPFAIE